MEPSGLRARADTVAPGGVEARGVGDAEGFGAELYMDFLRHLKLRKRPASSWTVPGRLMELRPLGSNQTLTGATLPRTLTSERIWPARDE